MLKLAIAASVLTLASISGVHAQSTTTCTCNSNAARTADAAALATLLQNKMVCASVGSEFWQEHHNGASSGVLWDYKLGPTDKVDPSEPVGTYVVNSDNTVTYSYSNGGGQYQYDVCYVSSNNTFTFCGANYGGRNISGAKIGGAGLTACPSVTVTSATVRAARGTR